MNVKTPTSFESKVKPDSRPNQVSWSLIERSQLWQWLMRRSAEVKVGQPQSAVHSSVLPLPIYPLTASRSVSGSTLLHVITRAADNRHFIRTRACRCSSCPCTGLTLCDRMPIETALLEVSDLSNETRRLRQYSPLSLQHYFFTVSLISISTCLQLTGWGKNTSF